MYIKSVYGDFCISFEGKTVVLSTSPKGVIRGHGSIIQEVSDLFLGFIFSAKVKFVKGTVSRMIFSQLLLLFQKQKLEFCSFLYGSSMFKIYDH